MHSLIITIDALSGPLDLTIILVLFVDWGYQGEELLSKAGTAGQWSYVGLCTLLAILIITLVGPPDLMAHTGILH